MQRARVTVRWNPGLHLRPASGLVRLAQRFSSEIRLRMGNTFADARSILGVVLLGASMGVPIDVEASGEDERDAIGAVQDYFNDGSDGVDAPAGQAPT